MKVVVFGGSGFLGSHVADALSDKGYEVTIYDLKSSPFLKDSQKMVIGDILDSEKVRAATKGADAIYHFAGVADLEGSQTKPLETVVQNIKGTTILLKASRLARAKRFIFASTVYVYSNKGGFYRCSKQAAELYVEEFERRYGLDYTIIRYGTVYGPRTNPHNGVYRYLKQALTENKIVCSGDGEEMREYIHARDAARLSAEILSDKHKNKHVIITGHHPMKFKDFLYMTKEILDNNVEIKFEKPQPDSAHYNLTPYSFIPKIGYKLTTNSYLDMGQGLLECINEIHSHCVKDETKKIKTMEKV